MKKLIAYILVAIVINSLIGVVNLAYANNEPTQNNESKILIAERKYQPAIVPKPDTLPGPEDTQKDGNKLDTRTILTEKLLPKATTGVIGFVSITSFVMLIVAGVRFSVAYGNDEAIGKAKTETIWAIVGLIISLLAYTIVKIVANIDISTPTQ